MKEYKTTEKGSNVKITERSGNSHLQNAIYTTQPASPQDHTGFVPTVPETNSEAKSYHDMMNVPVTSKKKKNR